MYTCMCMITVGLQRVFSLQVLSEDDPGDGCVSCHPAGHRKVCTTSFGATLPYG